MATRKRSKARKAHKKNPRRRRAKRSTAHLFKKKRRSHRANPSARRRRSARRNPKRAHHRRARRSNPSRRTHHRRRAHRRNPGQRGKGMNVYLAGALAVALSLGVGVLEGVVPALVIPRDFNLAQKVRMGLGAVGTGIGLFLVKKHPVLGLAIAAPSFAVLASGALNEWIAKLLAPASSTASARPTTQNGLVRQLGAMVSRIGAPNLGGYERVGGPPQLAAVFASDLGAVYGDNLGGMGAVYSNSMGDALAGAPAGAPWAAPTPFG